MASSNFKLGIIAGGGTLPVALTQACLETNRPFFVIGLKGYAKAADFSHLPYTSFPIGKAGQIIKKLHKEDITHVILAGRIERPDFSSLSVDIKGMRLISSLLRQYLQGDNAMLTGVITFLEKEGFHVIGADQIAPQLLTPKGILGKIKPDAKAMKDIALGQALLKKIGEYDIGQAAVIQHGRVLGIEGPEGTDNLMRRSLGGTVVKVKKPTQDARVDLPTIGPSTIELAKARKIQCIALEAGCSFILARKETLALANRYKIAVVGI